LVFFDKYTEIKVPNLERRTLGCDCLDGSMFLLSLEYLKKEMTVIYIRDFYHHALFGVIDVSVYFLSYIRKCLMTNYYFPKSLDSSSNLAEILTIFPF
jgi:hypothetical protein